MEPKSGRAKVPRLTRVPPIGENQTTVFVFQREFELGSSIKAICSRHPKFGDVCTICPKITPSVVDWIKTRLAKQCSLSSPYVAKVNDVYLSGKEMHIVFEQPEGQSLMDTILEESLREDEARCLFQQLVCAVWYLHQMGLDGLDIELENIFYDRQNRNLKFISFGFSEEDQEGRAFPLQYVSPEQIEVSSDYNPKTSDVWRLGVILYVILFRKFPFRPADSTSTEEQTFRILRGEWSITEECEFSPECIHLLKQLLATRSSDRIDIGNIMKSSWYTKDLREGILQFDCMQSPANDLSEVRHSIQ